MTDQSREPGRIDLRAIDEPAPPFHGEWVIAAAMSRAGRGAGRPGDVEAILLAHARPLLAAAAVLLLAAGTLLVAHHRARGEMPSNAVTRWAEAGHVPTNGELLATFHGYER